LKTCTKCKRELPLDQFCKMTANNHRDGLHYWCGDCRKELKRNPKWTHLDPSVLLKVFENAHKALAFAIIRGMDMPDECKNRAAYNLQEMLEM